MNKTAGRIFLLANLISTMAVAANETPPSNRPSPSPTPTEERVEESFPAQVTKPPAPGAVPPIAAEFAPVLKAYGFFMPQLVAASHGMGSFSQTNLSAVTEVAKLKDPSRASIQAQQSRFGLAYTASPTVRGRVEIDFIDFSKSSPTVQALPRLRLMKVDWDFAPKNTVFFGQDWDLFSPLAPHTYNYVGSQFRSGNSAFIRQHFGIISQQLEHFEFAASVGFGAPNATKEDGAAEIQRQPAYQLRATWMNGKTRVGASGIYSRFTYYTPQTPAGAPPINFDASAYGANLFAEFSVRDLETRMEFYTGQNLGSINMLTISVANPELNKLKEIGGFISLKQKIGAFSVFGGYGIAQIRNDDEVTTVTRGVSGMHSNQSARLGFDYEVSSRTKIYAESMHFNTEYVDTRETAFVQLAGFHLTL